MAIEWEEDEDVKNWFDAKGGLFAVFHSPRGCWIGKYAYLANNIELTATTADAAKLEIVERARVILTEALAALPIGGK